METVSGAHCSAQPNYRRHWCNQWLQRISQISEYLVMVSYLPLSQSIQRPNGLETIGLLHFWRLRELDQDTEWIPWMGHRWCPLHERRNEPFHKSSHTVCGGQLGTGHRWAPKPAPLWRSSSCLWEERVKSQIYIGHSQPCSSDVLGQQVSGQHRKMAALTHSSPKHLVTRHAGFEQGYSITVDMEHVAL